MITTVIVAVLMMGLVTAPAIKWLLSGQSPLAWQNQTQVTKMRRSDVAIGRGLRRLAIALTLLIIVLLTYTAKASNSPASNPASNSEWTPVVVSTLTPDARPVLGIDGNYHVVYELQLSNATRLSATLQQIEVLDARDPAQVIATYSGSDLLARLRTLGNTAADSPEMTLSETRLFLIDLAFDSQDAVPPRLMHRFNLQMTGAPAVLPSSPRYIGATLDLLPSVPVLGPPLAGKGWVAVNGCCAPDVGHRSTGLPINGAIYFAQRFAIDWVKLDDQGRIVQGDETQVQNYTDYGAEVLAVADGTVVDTLDTLADQTPPNGPDPNTINLQNVLGNHVILDLGNEQYVLYAHLQQGEVKVKPGDRVRRGQVLGKLGNTGNSTAPHLHLHLMSGSTLGSNGLPYVIDRFNVVGQIPAATFEASTSMDGSWSDYLMPQAAPRQNEFPLYLTIVDFPE